MLIRDLFAVLVHLADQRKKTKSEGLMNEAVGFFQLKVEYIVVELSNIYVYISRPKFLVEQSVFDL